MKKPSMKTDDETKARVHDALYDAYAKLLTADQQREAQKPEFRKHLDEKIADALKPLFT